MLPPKDDLRWENFVKNGKGCLFHHLSTKMMFKRCQNALRLRSNDPAAMTTAIDIAYNYFNTHGERVEDDLKVALNAKYKF